MKKWSSKEVLSDMNKLPIKFNIKHFKLINKVWKRNHNAFLIKYENKTVKFLVDANTTAILHKSTKKDNCFQLSYFDNKEEAISDALFEIEFNSQRAIRHTRKFIKNIIEVQ